MTSQNSATYDASRKEKCAKRTLRQDFPKPPDPLRSGGFFAPLTRTGGAMAALGTLDVPLYARGTQVGHITVPLSARSDGEPRGDTAAVRVVTGTPTVVLPLTACQRCEVAGSEVEVHGTVAGRSHLVATFTACADCRPDLFIV